jgi:hypothetical protein|tara:strand:+ start:355 stop:999 length:645 start_codon:yes stop_codon:yes gene_type:complete
MNITFFNSSPKKNVFAPEWKFVLAEDKITKVNFKSLAKLILKQEKTVLTSPMENNLRSQYIKWDKGYNLLDSKHPEIKKLQKAIIKIHAKFLKALSVPLSTELYIQCWANVMRTGEKMATHIHGIHEDAYLGGQISIQVGDTTTYYMNPFNQIKDPQIYKSKNEVGKIVLYQTCLPHYTDAETSTTPRITIAFDLIVNGNSPIFSTQKNFKRIY